MDNIPIGYCKCGCGQKTEPSRKTYTRLGIKKGDPNPYIRYHRSRVSKKIFIKICACGAEFEARTALKKLCTECHRLDSNKRQRVNGRAKRKTPEYKEVYRKYIIKKKYGITFEEYEAILLSQDSRCAICKSQDSKCKNDWHIDHDHKTGKVRGILCNNCNFMIGQSGDNPEVLIRAAKYLEINKEKEDKNEN